MENLEKLVNEKKFEKIIELTEGSKDCDSLFYRISAFMALNKLDEAIKVIDNNKVILQERLPFLMRFHIELLCLAKYFDEAYQEIKYYENLPYHSQEAEEMLKVLPKIVREYENMDSKKTLDEEDIIKNLLSKDNEKVLGALDAIRDLRIEPYIMAIQKLLISHPKQSIRSFCLLLLVQRAYPKKVKFKRDDKIIELIPANLKPPFVDESYDAFYKKMEDAYKDPSLTKNALSILSSYIIYIYPNSLELNDDLCNALYYVSCEYLQIDTTIVDKKIIPLIDKIKAAMDDF